MSDDASAEAKRSVKEIIEEKRAQLAKFEDYKEYNMKSLDLTFEINSLLGHIKRKPETAEMELSGDELKQVLMDAERRYYHAEKESKEPAKDTSEESSARKKYEQDLAFGVLDGGFTFSQRNRSTEALITDAKAAHVPPPTEAPLMDIDTPAPAIETDALRALKALQKEFSEARPGEKNFIGEGRQGIDKDDKTALVQQQLATMGYDVGAIDGDYGPKTAAAINKFQIDHGLGADGRAGKETLAKMVEEAEKTLSAKAAATSAEPTPPAAARSPDEKETVKITGLDYSDMANARTQLIEKANSLGMKEPEKFADEVMKATGGTKDKLEGGVAIDMDKHNIAPQNYEAAKGKGVEIKENAR